MYKTMRTAKKIFPLGLLRIMFLKIRQYVYDHHGWSISSLHYTDVEHRTKNAPVQCVHCDEPLSM